MLMLKCHTNGVKQIPETPRSFKFDFQRTNKPNEELSWDKAKTLMEPYLQRLEECMGGLASEFSQAGDLDTLSQAHQILTKDRRVLVNLHHNFKRLDRCVLQDMLLVSYQW